MSKKMLKMEDVALAQIAQRLESNFVPDVIALSIVDRFADNLYSQLRSKYGPTIYKTPPGMCLSRLDFAQNFVQGKGAG